MFKRHIVNKSATISADINRLLYFLLYPFSKHKHAKKEKDNKISIEKPLIFSFKKDRCKIL